MTRTNRTLVTKDGTEACLFPMDVCNVTQGTHFANNIYYNAYDLGGYYSHDNVHYEDVFAPCSMTVHSTQNNDSRYTNNVIFKSDDEVLLANGEKSIIYILMTHCDDVSWIGGPGTHYAQGEHCYNEGTFAGTDFIFADGTRGHGVGTLATHLHIEVAKPDADGNPDIEHNPYRLDNSLPLEQVFFVNGIEGKYANSLNGFITYDDSVWNGWVADGDYWYYYVEGVKKTGWLEDPENSAKWFYLDPTKGGAMSTGWIEVSGVDYYMNPANGQSGHDANLPGGQMTRSKWVAGGSKWYYIKESGAMAKSESVTVNGKKYNFDSNGVCLNP